MDLIGNAAIRRLRAIGRKLGLNRAIARYVLGSGYEDRFGKALEAAIRPGDVVWDVGANIGVYTERFSDLVGAEGRVIAFEPNAATFERLQAAVGARPNVSLHRLGLSNEAGEATMLVGADDRGATSQIKPVDPAESARVQTVRLTRADAFVAGDGAPEPNIVKIDVEGFERPVLDGFGALLRAPELRDVLVEVHFGLLSEMGRDGDVDAIKALLRDAGLALTWTDPSHLHASRAG